MSHVLASPRAASESLFVNRLIVSVISFVTLVDLFAAQAILPTLAASYAVSPATMAFAVNASTFGMAAAGLLIALTTDRIDQRTGVIVSLALLSIPTMALAFHPSLPVFTLLRVLQGVCMSSAFTLTMAYLAEHSCPNRLAGALAAYVTGNVASNLVGRFISAAIVDHYNLQANFAFFAALNLLGAVVAIAALHRVAMVAEPPARHDMKSKGRAWLAHVRNAQLRAAFGIGFFILFAFIGAFSYVNFILMRPPLGLSQMGVGFVYFVFLPSIVLTPLAGRLANSLGPARALRIALGLAALALPLLLLPSLSAVLAGLTVVAAGTFGAQAITTGVVSRLATTNRSAASGLYLAAYYLGGLIGTIVLGQVFMAFGWPSTVLAIALSLIASLALTASIKPHTAPMAGRSPQN